MSNILPKLPLADWIDAIVNWLTENVQWFFDPIRGGLSFFVDTLSAILIAIPSILFILVVTIFTYFISRKNITLTIVTFLGLFLIDNLQYWEQTMLTLTLVVTASIMSIVIGIPLGIWMSKNKVMESILTPILDFMQTMPAFVYLIPAVSFFGIGMVPGVIASVIFSMPPTVRLTNLGIRQVPAELIEAANAFGSTPKQKLYKLQLPIAKTTIMAGVNQTIMLALSMVVIASMIGADGLGTEVYRAITRNESGQGFESGLAIVILAIVIDRVTQNLNRKKYE